MEMDIIRNRVFCGGLCRRNRFWRVVREYCLGRLLLPSELAQYDLWTRGCGSRSIQRAAPSGQSWMIIDSTIRGQYTEDCRHSFSLAKIEPLILLLKGFGNLQAREKA